MNTKILLNKCFTISHVIASSLSTFYVASVSFSINLALYFQLLTIIFLISGKLAVMVIWS